MTTELVVARFAENLDWLCHIPSDIRVLIYNKGEALDNPRVLARAAQIEQRRNIGRESETYLHHLLTTGHRHEGFTVFCQGDPFSHSPDFLGLLEARHHWAGIQPLTDRWLSTAQVPPSGLLEKERSERLGGLRVRTELYSLHTWDAVRFHDDGAA